MSQSIPSMVLAPKTDLFVYYTGSGEDNDRGRSHRRLDHHFKKTHGATESVGLVKKMILKKPKLPTIVEYT